MAKYFSLLIVLLSLSPAVKAHKNEWNNRLFYVNGRSLVRQGPYFISPQGQNNPQQELAASLELLKKDPRKFACQYPARFLYLAPQMGIPTNILCDEFLSWRDSFEASGLSLMFASQYLENPASSFGHTYLKVNSHKKTLYLNKVISFAAAVPEKVGGGEYIWKGLTGGFEGAFAESPFYILFQEYANMEKRDIFEYELNFTIEETHEILAVLYELIKYAKFDYLFLSENCSSLLLRLLDIKAQKSFLDELPFYVIPIETAKILEKKGFIGKTIFHPSITSRMILQAQKMKAEEVKDFTQSLKGKKLTGSSSAATLDLSLEYLNFKRQKSAGVLSLEERKEFERNLLLRSKLPEKFSPVKIPALEPLRSSHPQRLSVGPQFTHSESGLSLTYRPAGKDFYDRPNGYARESEINILRTKIFMAEEGLKKSWFDLDVIGVRKYADWNLITKNSSWGVNLAVKSLVEDQCQNCYFTELDSHFGLGKNLSNFSLLSYIVFHPTLRVGHLNQHFHLLPHFEAGLIKSSDVFIFKTSFFKGYIYDQFRSLPFQEIRTSASWIINDEISLNLNLTHYHRRATWNSLQTELSYYF